MRGQEERLVNSSKINELRQLMSNLVINVEFNTEVKKFNELVAKIQNSCTAKKFVNLNLDYNWSTYSMASKQLELDKTLRLLDRIGKYNDKVLPIKHDSLYKYIENSDVVYYGSLDDEYVMLTHLTQLLKHLSLDEECFTEIKNEMLEMIKDLCISCTYIVLINEDSVGLSVVHPLIAELTNILQYFNKNWHRTERKLRWVITN